MIDQEVLDSQIKVDRFPFPSQGDITLGVRNANYTLGPVMLQLAMKPGAFIPAHVHKNVAEVLYILEGDLRRQALSSRHNAAHQGRQRARSAHHGERMQGARPLDGTHLE